MQHDQDSSAAKNQPVHALEAPSFEAFTPADENDEQATDGISEGTERGITPRERFETKSDQPLFVEWISADLPIELEIGSGKGLFLTNAAQARPENRFVGLELAGSYAVDCQSRIEKLGIPNARFFSCDAVAVIDSDVPDNTLTAVHVYFPDPWWKSRHKKRRVLSEKTLRNIERTLKPSGSFHFWTDVLDYYEQTLELIDQVTKLNGPFFVSEPPSTHDMDYLTHFERRTRKNGLPVYRSRFTKS
jgi:tRNA (guanine-N7-)-methyltransferase